MKFFPIKNPINGKLVKNVNLLIPIMVFLNNINVFWENFPVKIIYFRGGVKK